MDFRSSAAGTSCILLVWADWKAVSCFLDAHLANGRVAATELDRRAHRQHSWPWHVQQQRLEAAGPCTAGTKHSSARMVDHVLPPLGRASGIHFAVTRWLSCTPRNPACNALQSRSCREAHALCALHAEGVITPHKLATYIYNIPVHAGPVSSMQGAPAAQCTCQGLLTRLPTLLRR